MAAVRAFVASDNWVAKERENCWLLTQQEMEDMIFPAINQVAWLNEHIADLWSGKYNIVQAFKTPGKLRTGKTPAFKRTYEHKSSKKSPTKPRIEVQEPVQEQPQIAEPHNSPPKPSPVQLYTDSEIGSPSVHATPDVPTRKASFSFAPLPSRDLTAVPAVSATRQQSLGLDSEASDTEDNESIDLRAPELIAHDERMRAYESPSPAVTPKPTPAREETNVVVEQHSEETVTIPTIYPSLEQLEDEPEVATPRPAPRRTRSLAKQEAEAEAEAEAQAEEKEIEQDTAAAVHMTSHEATTLAKSQTPEAVDPVQHLPSKPQPSTKTTVPRETSRLRAPKNIGRPVRPSSQALVKPKVQPLAIKIKPLPHPRPVNTAPVAAHNQETVYHEPQPAELKKMASLQSITSTTFIKPTKALVAPSKVFANAQKKKELDEKAAARDAAIKQQQKERRDNKIEELRNNKLQDEAERDRKARENSAEKRKQHIVDIEDRDVKRQKSEERQEREQAAADAKKAAFREVQEKRQIRPATRPVARPQPTTQPTRPPARLDHHHDDDSELPAYPNNLSKPPVRVSNLGHNKKPSFLASQQAAPSAIQNFPQPPRGPPQLPNMQQYATQRIPFANEMPPPPQQQQQHARLQAQVPGINTPFAPMHHMQMIQTINDTSPMSLPEIHTDSSDDTDRDVSLPSWATPGHIFSTLTQQETVNPDLVFPRIPAISMDDVFAENPDRLRRLRIRTSSANWVRTGDALTQVEVIEDRIGRQAIRNAGGWVYNVGNGASNR